jgi:transposase
MDPEDLRRENEELRAELKQQRRLNSGIQQQMARVLDRLVQLEEELAKKRKKKPKKGKGKKKSKSKKEPPAEAPTAPTRVAPTPPAEDKGIPRRSPPPDHLERNTEQHAATPSRCCSDPVVVQVAPKVIEQRDYVPARIEVRRVELEQYKCQTCEATHQAPMPPMALPNGSLTARLLAHIAVGKCAMSLPLTRIGEYLATLGLDLASSTMCNAMDHVARLVEPIYDRITARLFGGPVLLMDATGMKVLQPGETGTHRGQFVVYCNDEISVFDYNKDKRAHHFEKFLRVADNDAYTGKVVADSANNMTCLESGGRIRCGCWQHARNNFKEARASAPKEAEEAIAWIGTFFDVEREATAAGDDPDERLERRRRETIPLMRGFERWMAATQHKFDPDEDLWKAIKYCSNHRIALRRCLTDGLVPLENNLAERELGVIGRGRRGYLFAGSDASGAQLAKIYTVIRTCQRMAVAPWDYLAWVLPKLSDLPVNRGKGHLNSLTPWAYRDMAIAI